MRASKKAAGRRAAQRERGQRMREKWIDVVKAISILFVLLGHARVKIPYISALAVLFYVPVFFVLAGYLHHHRPEEGYITYVKKRAKRLLLPYFAYSLFLLLFFVGKEAAAGSVQITEVFRSLGGILYGVNTIRAPESLETVYKPLLNIWNAPMWFLPALFLAEILFEGMLRFYKNKRSSVLWACILCAVFGMILSDIAPILLPWSLETVLLSEIMLATGRELKNHGMLERIAGKPWLIGLLLLGAGVLRKKNGAMNISIGIWGRSTAIGLLAALMASAAVMALVYRLDKLFRGRWREGLYIIGQNTMPVLCLHLFIFMFVQAGIQLFLPNFPHGRGMIYEMARIGMVIVTMDVIVIGNLWFTQFRGNQKQKNI